MVERPDERRRLEIVHESLLSNWPRLVRWRTQDAEGAQLRDDLRQAAKRWEQKGRPGDLLWTGASFREYELWSERYPGGLTEFESAFSQAMLAKAERRKRQRRWAVAIVVTLALGVAAVMAVLWRRSVAEAQRAEAAEILALGRAEIASDPTRALAYSLASLEVADSAQARRFAVEALWRGPPKRILLPPEPADFLWLNMSRDGRWIALSGHGPDAYVWSNNGGAPTTLSGLESFAHNAGFGPSGQILAARSPGRVRRWQAPDWSEVESLPIPAGAWASLSGERILVSVPVEENPGESYDLEAWSYEGERLAGPERWQRSWTPGPSIFHSTGAWVSYGRENELFVRPLEGLTPGDERLVGRHPAPILGFIGNASGSRIVSRDAAGELRVWDVTEPADSPVRILTGDPQPPPEASLIEGIALDAHGSRLAARNGQSVRVWDLALPQASQPLELRDTDSVQVHGMEFDPSGRWLAVNNHDSVLLWPLPEAYPRTLSASVFSLAFDPDGEWLATSSIGEGIYLWPFADGPGERSLLFSAPPGSDFYCSLAVTPDGTSVVAGVVGRGVWIVPVDGSPPRQLPGPERILRGHRSVAVSVDGRLVASGAGGSEEGLVIPIWELASGELVRVLDPGAEPTGELGLYSEGIYPGGIKFTPDGRLITAGKGGVRLWDVEKGTSQMLIENPGADDLWGVQVSPDGKSFLVLQGALMESRKATGNNLLYRCNLTSLACEPMRSHGAAPRIAAFDPTGSHVISGDLDGILRVGPASNAEPHLLFGGEDPVWGVSVSPDGHWVATWDDEGMLRLWPMPELSRIPLHVVPREELLAKLRSFTNLRVVQDESSVTGYAVRIEENPGWREEPTW